MKYSEWEPVYEKILSDFSFDRREDEKAAKILSELIRDPGDKKELEKLIKEKKILICGNAPKLEEELKEIDPVDYECVIAADGATSILLKNGVIPDIIVTDLDGILGDIIYANALGSIVVVHAHGDNVSRMKKVVPQLRRVIGTTQAEPFDDIHNFGGFTDGDRCVFLAREFGAREINLVGFDFEDEDVSPVKKKKLKWAEKLISTIL
ncbi:MAG: 6-hydroxymethylpterin diphosphokinase MptE-like protein [Candidatus Syntropharchaeia archaeon]